VLKSASITEALWRGSSESIQNSGFGCIRGGKEVEMSYINRSFK